MYDTESWFALQVRPRHERTVDMTLAWKGYEHFLPTWQARRGWSDRIKVLEQPLFPGYVFCKSRGSLLMELVRSTPGIIRIVSFRGKPQPVLDEEINSLQRIVRVERDFCPVLYFTAGQKVRITAGPLAGITGIITRLRQRHRLVVSVDIVMQSMSVEIDRLEVELAECGAK